DSGAQLAQAAAGGPAVAVVAGEGRLGAAADGFLGEFTDAGVATRGAVVAPAGGKGTAEVVAGLGTLDHAAQEVVAEGLDQAGALVAQPGALLADQLAEAVVRGFHQAQVGIVGGQSKIGGST